MIARNILVLSYWSLREPLTAAAVFPYLKILTEREDISEIHLVTLETTSNHLPQVDLDIPKVILHQVKPVAQYFFILSKVLLLLSAIRLILHLDRKRKIDLIFAKASMAGAIAQIVNYPGAYHYFDRANLPLHERTGLAFTPDGSGRE